jgi:hypothetical protein
MGLNEQDIYGLKMSFEEAIDPTQHKVEKQKNVIVYR